MVTDTAIALAVAALTWGTMGHGGRLTGLGLSVLVAPPALPVDA